MRGQPDNEVALTIIIFARRQRVHSDGSGHFTVVASVFFRRPTAIRLPENPMIARCDLCGKGYRHAGDWERSSG